MSTDKKPFIQVVELEPDKLMVVTVVNQKQLQALYEVFEPLSRSWRGQYQAMAKAFVEDTKISYHTKGYTEVAWWRFL